MYMKCFAKTYTVNFVSSRTLKNNSSLNKLVVDIYVLIKRKTKQDINKRLIYWTFYFVTLYSIIQLDT